MRAHSQDAPRRSICLELRTGTDRTVCSMPSPLAPPLRAALTNCCVQASQQAAVGEGDEQLTNGQPRLAGPRQHDGQLQEREVCG